MHRERRRHSGQAAQQRADARCTMMTSSAISTRSRCRPTKWGKSVARDKSVTSECKNFRTGRNAARLYDILPDRTTESEFEPIPGCQTHRWLRVEWRLSIGVVLVVVLGATVIWARTLEGALI